MDGVLRRVSPVLYLTRVTTAFAAVGNVWFMILWSRAAEPERAAAPTNLSHSPLWLLLLGATGMAVGLFSFATAMNDAIDARRDRSMHPERPLPAGRLSLDVAASVIAFALILAILGATVVGLSAVLLVLLAASAILFYNLIGRFIPSIGLVLLSLIYGAHMVAANANILFVWPIWLVMTHALLVGAAVHRISGKRPALTTRVILAAAAGWAFWSAVLLWVGWRRTGALWPEWVPWSVAVAPLLLAAGYAAYIWLRIRRARDRARAAERAQRYGALWLPIYETAWLFGMGFTNEGLILTGLAVGGFLGMTILREIYGLIEQPVGYRRV